MAERKKFIEVKIPILQSNIKVLGTPLELKNKTIKLDLTRKLRGKGLMIKLKIFNGKKKLFAIPCRMELMKSYIRRITRKGTDYVEDSFKGQCADITATIKPFLITRKKVSRAVRKNLRNTAKEFLIDYIKEKNFNEICEELKSGILQKTMLPKLKKIYPLAFCDIRIFETKEIEKVDLERVIKQEENLKEISMKEGSPGEENIENSEEETEENPDK